MSMEIAGTRFYTVKETSQASKYTTRYIRRLIRDGEIPAQKPGNEWFIAEHEVEALANKKYTTGRPRSGNQ